MQTLFFKNCVKGLLAAMLTSLCLIFLFGWISNSMEDPSRLLGLFGRSALYISAFIGGFVSARANMEKGLVSGLATGGIFMLVVIMLSLFLRDGSSPMGFITWVMFLFVALIGGVGGYFGVPSTKKRKKKNKKKR
ncbi:MAG: TIGR04086 family membrane protein [Clostridia bacterium]|nr:TIGR04086 family membrane protein [Clostridia bacterium]